jgi:hypothetical protein
MEKHDATPIAPLVIDSINEEYREGSIITCRSHKAVKTAMSLIHNTHPEARYMMHIGPMDLFGLIDLTRADCIKIMNKIIKASDYHGYINKDSGKTLKVVITVSWSNYYGDTPKVSINMGAEKINE